MAKKKTKTRRKPAAKKTTTRTRTIRKKTTWEDVGLAAAGAVAGAVVSGYAAATMAPKPTDKDANDPAAYPWGFKNPGLYVALAGAILATQTKRDGAVTFGVGMVGGGAAYAAVQEAARMAFEKEKEKSPGALPGDYSVTIGDGYKTGNLAGIGRAAVADAAPRIRAMAQRATAADLVSGTPDQAAARIQLRDLVSGTPDHYLAAAASFDTL